MSITCEICGGTAAPIISGKHLGPHSCASHRATTILFELLVAYHQAESNPAHFSNSNPDKVHYYRLLNIVLDKLTMAYEESASIHEYHQTT